MPEDAAPPVAGRFGHARVAVLTIIDEEFDAVRGVFGAIHEVGTTGIYAPINAAEAGPEGRASYPFVLAQATDRSNTPAGERPKELARLLRPEVFVVVGIAGGVMRQRGQGAEAKWKGPGPGDIVVARYVHYGEYAKHLQGGSQRRYFAIDHPASHLVVQHGLGPERDVVAPPWRDEIRAERPVPGQPSVEVGEILAVEGIAGSPSRPAQAEMLGSYDNAIAVDMESMGVGRALHDMRSSVHYNPTWMCVRGISDPVYVLAESSDGDTPSGPPGEDNNTARAAWKPYAAEAAAVYAKRIVERILKAPRPPVPADQGASAWNFPTASPETVGA